MVDGEYNELDPKEKHLKRIGTENVILMI